MTWSQQLSDKFALDLSDELCDWFDGEIWQQFFTGTYMEFVPPDDLLNHESYVIYGGQLLPDMLPLARDGMGGVLAVRIGTDGREVEVATWDTMGFIAPWGDSLSEALVFNLACALDDEELSDDELEEAQGPVLDWSLRWLGHKGVDVGAFRTGLSRGQAIAAIQRSGLCLSAVNENLAGRHLMTFLERKCREEGGQLIADAIGVDWREMSSWFTQPKGIAEQHRLALADRYGVSSEHLVSVDLGGAVECAKRVTGSRSDLAWPFAVLGRDARERGDDPAEAEFLAAELRAPAITAAFTETWTAPPGRHSERFTRLREHLTGLDDLQLIEMKANGDPRPYWIEKARQAEQSSDHATAYRCWFLAGWDDYHSDGMEEIMDALQRTATAAGFSALARVVEHHKKTVV